MKVKEARVIIKLEDVELNPELYSTLEDMVNSFIEREELNYSAGLHYYKEEEETWHTIPIKSKEDY